MTVLRTLLEQFIHPAPLPLVRFTAPLMFWAEW